MVAGLKRFDPHQPRDPLTGEWSPAAGGGSLASLLPHVGEYDEFGLHEAPALHREVHRAFDASSGGLTASINDQASKLYRDGDGQVVVRAEGVIRNTDNQVVGSFRRNLYPESGIVHNDTFALAASEQGAGFAQRFAAHSEAVLAGQGFRRATVSASGVGGYAWARRYGWDPAKPTAAGDVPDRLAAVASRYPLTASDSAKVSAWLRAFRQPDQSQWPTPAQVANFGKGTYYGLSGDRMVWPGKEAMIGSSWSGVRDLGRPGKARKRFDPGQPRDGHGQWTSGAIDVDGTFGTLTMSADKVGDVQISFDEAGTGREVELDAAELGELADVLRGMSVDRDYIPAETASDALVDTERFGADEDSAMQLYGNGIITVTFGVDDDDPYTLTLDPPYEADPTDPEDEDSDDVQAVLDAIAEVLGAVTGGTGGRSAKRFDPNQTRDPHTGEWVDATPAGPPSGGRDALKVAGKIDLEPGEQLLGSGKVDAASGGIRMALTERNGERMLRLGLGSEGYGQRNRDEGIAAWDGNPSRAPLTPAEREGLGAEDDALDEEWEAAPPARQEAIEARKDEIRERLAADDEGFNGTAELDEYSMRRLAEKIRPAIAEAVEQEKAENAAWDEIEQLEAQGNPDPVRMARLREIARAGNTMAGITFTQGILPGSRWGDVHYSVELDDASVGAYVSLGVMPKGAPDDWGDDKDWQGHFDAAETKKFLRLLAKLTAGVKRRAGQSTSDHRKAGGWAAMDRKALHGLQVKSTGQGQISAVFCTFGVVDHDGDVVYKAAIPDGKPVVISAYNHASWGPGAVPVGKGVIRIAGNEAILDGHFFMDTTEGSNTFNTLKQLGDLAEYSWGFDVLDGTPNQHGGRDLKSVDVHEVSPVLKGASIGTRTLSLKERGAAGVLRRRGIGVHETTTVSRPWDSAAMEKSLDTDRPSDLRTVYAWVDPDGDPELKASYRFPHHHGVKGPANLRACLAGIAVLNGARGGSSLPPADRKAVYEHLASHLRDADREPPELRASDVPTKFNDELLETLAGVSGLLDSAQRVVALRASKGKSLSKVNAELLGWIADDLKRLDTLLTASDTDADDEPTEDEIASTVLAALARIHAA